MSGSKKTTKQSSTQTTTPAARPELQFALDQNRELFDTLSGRVLPEFGLTAGFAPEQNQAFDLIAQRALAGSPVAQAAQGAVGDIASFGAFGQGGVPANAAAEFFLPTARGDFLDFAGNPVFQQGVQNINDQVGSIFERAGRTGSGANQAAVSRGVGDFAAGVFNQERANQLAASQALASIFGQDISNQFQNAGLQLGAAGLAPSLAALDFADLEALANVGGARQAQEQREIDEAFRRQQFPFENAIQAQQLLNQGTAGLGPLLGATQTGESETVEKTGGGLLNSILGGGLLAASLFGGGGPLASLFGGGATAGGAPAAGRISGAGGFGLFGAPG